MSEDVDELVGAEGEGKTEEEKEEVKKRFLEKSRFTETVGEEEETSTVTLSPPLRSLKKLLNIVGDEISNGHILNIVQRWCDFAGGVVVVKKGGEGGGEEGGKVKMGEEEWEGYWGVLDELLANFGKVFFFFFFFFFFRSFFFFFLFFFSSPPKIHSPPPPPSPSSSKQKAPKPSKTNSKESSSNSSKPTT